MIDDEPKNRLLLAAILEPAGYELSEAADGASALRVAKQVRPDLVILDLHMPGMSGADFLRELRSDPDLAAVKVALYTATTTNPDMAQFMALHHIGHMIPKPSEPPAVLDAVSSILQS